MHDAAPKFVEYVYFKTMKKAEAAVRTLPPAARWYIDTTDFEVGVGAETEARAMAFVKTLKKRGGTDKPQVHWDLKEV